MNKLSMCNITDIAVQKRVFEPNEQHGEFTIIDINATDENGTTTYFALHVKPDYNIDIDLTPKIVTNA